MKKPVLTAAAPKPGGSYSQGIVSGGLLFTAGMGPFDPGSGEIVGETIEEQTRQTLSNLDSVLSEAGLGRDDVVKVTAHLEDLDRDFGGYDQIYAEFFKPPFPARTTVGSHLDGILLEVDLIAVREQRSGD